MVYCMVIHEFFYSEDSNLFSVEFSTKEDGDDFYRVLKLEFDVVQYYSPTIISKDDLLDFNEDQITEILLEYFEENELPEQISL